MILILTLICDMFHSCIVCVVPDIGMEDKEKRQTTNPHKMGLEWAWQTSSTSPVPKILVHCIIDRLPFYHAIVFDFM
jgi:hypothetical protein